MCLLLVFELIHSSCIEPDERTTIRLYRIAWSHSISITCEILRFVHFAYKAAHGPMWSLSNTRISLDYIIIQPMSWAWCHAKTAIDEDKLILHRNVVHVPFGANPIRETRKSRVCLSYRMSIKWPCVVISKFFSVRESLHSWRISHTVHTW